MLYVAVVCIAFQQDLSVSWLFLRHLFSYLVTIEPLVNYVDLNFPALAPSALEEKFSNKLAKMWNNYEFFPYL